MKRTYTYCFFNTLIILVLLLLPGKVVWAEELGIKGNLTVKENLTVQKDATIEGKLFVKKQALGGLVPIDGLVLDIGFNTDDGTLARDNSGNGIHAIVNGATWQAQGSLGGAMLFDGTDDYLEIPDNPLLDVTDFTISLWIKRTETEGLFERAIMKKLITGVPDNYNHFGMWIENDYGQDNEIVLDVANGNTFSRQCTGLFIDDTEWHHIVYTFKNDTRQWECYKDGVKATGYHTVSGAPNAGPLILGAHVNMFGQWAGLFDGAFDQFRLYNRALTQDEVMQLFTETSGGGEVMGEFAAGKISATEGITQTSETGINSFMGNVGLGTVTPQEKLHVVGNALIEGNLGVSGQLSSDLNAGGHKVTNLGAPADSGDAATKAYVDGIIAHIPEMGDLTMGEFTGE